ncbi:helix-turn-helix transcriptional regulator [Spirosoma arcticum]
MQSFKEALYVWDAFQCLFLGLILLFLRRNQCNRILSFFFLIGGALVTLQYFFNFRNYLYILPEFSFVADVIRLSFAPTLYLYIYLVLKKKLPPAWGLYYLPAAIFALYFVTFQLLQHQPYHIKYYAFTPLRPVVLACLCIVFLFWLWRLNSLIRAAQPAQPHIRKWIYVLRTLLWFKAIPVLYLFTLRMIVGFYNKDYVESSQQIIFILLDVVIMLVVLIQLFQYPFILALPRVEPTTNQLVEPSIFGEIPASALGKVELPALPDSKQEEDVTRRKIHISPEEARPYLDRLAVLMRQEKAYLTPELNEKMLADAVGIQPYLLSKLLNDHVGETFNEFLNRNRIDEAKRLLVSPKSNRYTIFAIALECGYNSESVFYTNFKRYTGLTPKKYKEEKSQTSTV